MDTRAVGSHQREASPLRALWDGPTRFTGKGLEATALRNELLEARIG